MLSVISTMHTDRPKDAKQNTRMIGIGRRYRVPLCVV